MEILIILAVTGVGLLMYLLCEKPKAQRVGEIAFFCGLLVLLLSLGKALALARLT